MAEADILTPGSASYNKARKQYMKSNRNRPSGTSSNWTSFRAAEKKYMARFPPPDLSEALDLALIDEERREEVDGGKWKGRADAITTREIGLKNGEADKGKRRAYSVPQIPGLVILPGYLKHETQRRLVRWSLAEHSREPNETNLDAHYTIPSEGLWSLYSRTETSMILRRDRDSSSGRASESASEPQLPFDTQTGGLEHSEAYYPSRPTTPSLRPEAQGSATASDLLPKLRWANIGWFYNWGSKEYEFDRGKPDVGEPVRTMCKDIVASIDWKAVFAFSLQNTDEFRASTETGADWDGWDSSYEPDAGIVNFYQYRDRLMGHVDRAEVCATSPLVSLSLGNAAVFLIGGPTRNDKPAVVLLRSGDVVVMAGPGCRRAYHGVPRILEGSIPVHFDANVESNADWVAYSQYLQTTRINVNVRQVFPKDYVPWQA